MKTISEIPAPAFPETVSSHDLVNIVDTVTGRGVSFFQRIKTRFMNAIVQEMPDDLAACEMCRETHCTQKRWASCPRRLDAARELSRK